MKRAYHFVNETVEIEVEEKWDQVLKELDRLEYNNNHTETRRHSPLDGPAGKGVHIRSKENLEEEAERLEEMEMLKQAVATLGQAQKDLLRRVYLLEEKQSEIAKAEGVQRTAISGRLQRIYTQLKKFFEKTEKRP